MPMGAEVLPFKLVSFILCPYAQRAAVVAAEKEIAVERVMIELSAKPDWFVKLSPTGKVPMLLVGDVPLFESAAIAEFLDEIGPGSLLPEDPVERARHRAWVEYASGTLADIAGLYSAAEASALERKRAALAQRFARMEEEVAGPWFGGDAFGLVDAAFAPVFRYLDAFEEHADLFLLKGLPEVQAWRTRLARRPSVARAVAPDYPQRLHQFLCARGSHLSSRIAARASASVPASSTGA
jgi:glutathione S-transferase